MREIVDAPGLRLSGLDESPVVVLEMRRLPGFDVEGVDYSVAVGAWSR